jgi:hypothetical protein
MNNLIKKANWKEIASMTTVVLTALGALYLGLAQVWGLPFGQEVTQTIGFVVVAISTILGTKTVAKVNNREVETMEDK